VSREARWRVSFLTEAEARSLVLRRGRTLAEAELRKAAATDVSTMFGVFLSHSFADAELVAGVKRAARVRRPTGLHRLDQRSPDGGRRVLVLGSMPSHRVGSGLANAPFQHLRYRKTGTNRREQLRYRV
jgi:hypothetical protein